MERALSLHMCAYGASRTCPMKTHASLRRFGRQTYGTYVSCVRARPLRKLVKDYAAERAETGLNTTRAGAEWSTPSISWQTHEISAVNAHALRVQTTVMRRRESIDTLIDYHLWCAKRGRDGANSVAGDRRLLPDRERQQRAIQQSQRAKPKGSPRQ
jgi:hypothetical protein